MRTAGRERLGTAGLAAPRAGARPVMLATLGAPFEPEAMHVAVDTAVESGQRLIVVNVVELLLAPMEVMLGWNGPEEPEAAEVRAAAELAVSLGVPAEHLRVKSPHPVPALLEVIAEREPGLVVFGPDRRRIKPRLFRKAVKTIRAEAPCLVWLPD